MGWIKARLKRSSDALPPTSQTFLRSIYKLLKWPDRKRTERVFNAATSTGERLPPESLPNLVDSYPSPPPYSYTAEALETRGRTRAKQILNLPGSKGSRVFLELGCWDGMVGWALARHGKKVIGIDSRSEGFDTRARAAGVDLQTMDAEAMTLADNSADFVYSYDAFEHFTRPDLVLSEITRVIRPGGYVWLEFGPLYLSAFGPHIYRTIPVPYCHLLWSRDVLGDYAASKGAPIDFRHVNEWRVGQFRELFRSAADLETVRYEESLELDHLDVLRQYPALAKQCTDDFEDLIVSHIRILLRRRP